MSDKEHTLLELQLARLAIQAINSHYPDPNGEYGMATVLDNNFKHYTGYSVRDWPFAAELQRRERAARGLPPIKD